MLCRVNPSFLTLIPELTKLFGLRLHQITAHYGGTSLALNRLLSSSSKTDNSSLPEAYKVVFIEMTHSPYLH
ncbi:hypothetical protein Ocin01_12693 [Orchesella cincta]|uniref:Uncharacterized protein n=1 Tax=Orchesella cincta TaxID=48709 RepID=A0A1D2MLV1_ORCCI|nr:hypothetical protein Ocin01_12693 [Orchesella cincta]